VLERLGQAAQKAAVGLPQHEAQVGRYRQRRVGLARVVQRPIDQLAHELGRETRVGRTLRAGQQHHHRRSLLEAIVEQVPRERVVLRARRELPHVPLGAQRADASAGAAPQLGRQLRRHRRIEQLLLAAKVLVKVAHGRARPLGHRRHAGSGIAKLCEGFGGGGHERALHVVFGDLSHLKRTIHSLFWAATKKRMMGFLLRPALTVPRVRGVARDGVVVR
jgi:hypothetical protein